MKTIFVHLFSVDRLNDRLKVNTEPPLLPRCIFLVRGKKTTRRDRRDLAASASQKLIFRLIIYQEDLNHYNQSAKYKKAIELLELK